jgi:hypothetical protein
LEKQGWCLMCITCKYCCPGHLPQLTSSAQGTIGWRRTG